MRCLYHKCLVATLGLWASDVEGKGFHPPNPIWQTPRAELEKALSFSSSALWRVSCAGSYGALLELAMLLGLTRPLLDIVVEQKELDFLDLGQSAIIGDK